MFPGSHDQETAVTNAFVVPMLASSVRITPYSYVGIALRLELYGYGPLNEIIGKFQKVLMFQVIYNVPLNLNLKTVLFLVLGSGILGTFRRARRHSGLLRVTSF